MFTESTQLYLIIGVLAFLSGYLAAKLGAYMGKRGFMDSEDPRNHRIRALEADLRLAERQLQDQTGEINTQQGDLENLVRKSTELEQQLVKRDEEIDKLEEDVKISCAKTIELRHELTDRAEQTIRGAAALDDLETELHVAKAAAE